jgi:lipopolysaccharide assembly protein A
VINLILMLVFALALGVFAVQNPTAVQLHFLRWTSQSFSLSILVILSAAVGAVLAFVLSIPTHHNRRKKLKQKERELQDLRDAIGKH